MTGKDWNYERSADRSLVERARAKYPHAPEHFRAMVEQAIALQMQDEKRKQSMEQRQQDVKDNQENTEQRQQDVKDNQENTEQRQQDVERSRGKIQKEYGTGWQPQVQTVNHSKESTRRAASKNRKKSWYKILLPLAASLVLGCAAVAAGGYFLYQRMLEKGFTQKEVDLLLVTEPEQHITELTGMVYPDGPTKEKGWKEPLLEIQEAYFDGNTLYFLAEGSEESANYELYLRDHGTVSGYDGITYLEKLEEERFYLGEITLMDLEAADKIIENDSAEVVITAIAYPKYDGNILYAWKDAEAYDEIFGIGAFEDKEYGLCYVLPQEDVNTGYTPHQITMQVPLTKEAKAVIEQYRIEAQGISDALGGNIQEEEGMSDALDGNVQEEEGMSDAFIERRKMSISEEEIYGAVNPSEHEGRDYENKKAAQAASISVEESHVTATLPGTERNLYIDAEIVQGTEKVYTGILELEKVDLETLMELYQSGVKDRWMKNGDTNESIDEWRYEGKQVFVSNDEVTYYQNKEGLTEDHSVHTDSAAVYQKKCEPGKEIEFCELVLEHIGIPASAAGYDDTLNTETHQTILAKPLLEGLTVAWKSQCVSTCNLVLQDGILASITAPQKMKAAEKNTADLADMQKIMEKLAEYVSAGEITMNEGDQSIYEIQLEYYVDLTRKGIVFRPIWNFKSKALWDGTEKSVSAENYFYIDAITGALIRDCYGY